MVMSFSYSNFYSILPPIDHRYALFSATVEGNQNQITLPLEFIYEILKYLPVSMDPSLLEVCKTWNKVVRVLPDLTLKIFGQEAWSEYFGFSGEEKEPPLPKNIFQTTRFYRSRLRGEKEAPLFTAILMPKNLSFNKLRELMGNPIKGIETKFKVILQDIVQKYGQETVMESYWFVIANDCIEGSVGETRKVQNALIKNKIGNDSHFPRLLEALVCCVMHRVSSSIDYQFFKRSSWIYTRCQETIDGSSVVVAGYSKEGFVVLRTNQYYDRIFGCESGVAACRRFEGKVVCKRSASHQT